MREICEETNTGSSANRKIRIKAGEEEKKKQLLQAEIQPAGIAEISNSSSVII